MTLQSKEALTRYNSSSFRVNSLEIRSWWAGLIERAGSSIQIIFDSCYDSRILNLVKNCDELLVFDDCEASYVLVAARTYYELIRSVQVDFGNTEVVLKQNIVVMLKTNDWVVEIGLVLFVVKLQELQVIALGETVRQYAFTRFADSICNILLANFLIYQLKVLKRGLHGVFILVVQISAFISESTIPRFRKLLTYPSRLR